MSSENIDDQVDSILHQLGQIQEVQKKATKKPFHLNPEDVENFIIQKSGMLIEESLDIVQDIKELVSHGGTDKEILALSDLIKAATSAIDTLGKIAITDKKVEAQKKLKRMDIEGKKEILALTTSEGITDDSGMSVKTTREALFDQILAAANVIEIIDEKEVTD